MWTGTYFPISQSSSSCNGKYPGIPVIIGSNTDETLGWADTAGQVTDEASYGAAIDKVFGTAIRDRILALYSARAEPQDRGFPRHWRGRFSGDYDVTEALVE
jgi:carboxylesterase type B